MENPIINSIMTKESKVNNNSSTRNKTKNSDNINNTETDNQFSYNLYTDKVEKYHKISDLINNNKNDDELNMKLNFYQILSKSKIIIKRIKKMKIWLKIIIL